MARKFDETADVQSKRPEVREPWLVISSSTGVRAIPLPRAERVVIGRMHTCDIVIDDESVSRQHAAIHVGPNGMSIEDLGSRNKTKLAGRALSKGEFAPLAVGNVVEVGYATMFIQVGRPQASPARTVPPPTSGSATTPPNSSDAQAIVHDATMQRLYALLDVIAPSQLNVVILGETGTGKEVFAEAMHKGSARSTAPFLKINCAALSGSLLESELFGHEKGAFTGALMAKAGLFEAADGGTVFLDEVGELPLETQAKLLRVIEYGEVFRLGSIQPKKVDVRYVAATNRDLTQAIAQNRFRSDLYFRLNGFTVTLPPLNKRRADIMPLARYFLDRAAKGKPYSVTPESQAALEHHAWPGNVRELKNVLERALVLSGPTGRIEPFHLQLPPPSVPQSAPQLPQPFADMQLGPNDTWPPMQIPPALLQGVPPGGAPQPHDLRAQRDSWEKQQILQALEKTSGNQKEAAKLLGVSRRTLINKIEAYSIARPRKKT